VCYLKKISEYLKIYQKNAAVQSRMPNSESAMRTVPFFFGYLPPHIFPGLTQKKCHYFEMKYDRRVMISQ